MRGRKLLTTAFIALIALGTLPALVWFLHTRPELASYRVLAERLAGYGWLAPVLIVALQFAQVLLAPVPGQAISLASGYLLGPLWGSVCSLAGLAAGSLAAMLLARRWGRPLAERLAGGELLARLDRLFQRGGLWFLALAFLLPFFPDDALCFLAGLSSAPIPVLMLIAVIGRTPGVIVAALAGAGLRRLTVTQWVLLTAAFGLLAIATLHQRRRIEKAAFALLQAIWGG